jgi:peptide/nickel transport system permease protein
VMLRFSGLVLSEAVLTYLGIGVDPSMQSWGAMLNAARFELVREPAIWWNFATAMLFMLGLVLPINILGETVRDALDPTLRIQ